MKNSGVRIEVMKRVATIFSPSEACLVLNSFAQNSRNRCLVCNSIIGLAGPEGQGKLTEAGGVVIDLGVVLTHGQL